MRDRPRSGVSAVSRRRRLAALAAAAAAGVLTACGGGAPARTAGHSGSASASASSSASASGSSSASGSVSTSTSTSTSATAAAPRPRPRPLGSPKLTPAATSTTPTNFVPAVSWRGGTAIYVARRPGLALLSLNQKLVELHLHSGTVDAGSSGYRYGPAVLGFERRRLVAGFNSGFRLSTNSGGFESGGRVALPLSPGLGSIVTYTGGYTDIGAWHQGVPAAGRRVESVRQNLHLLISSGHVAANIGCLLCWGATLGGTPTPARSGLGITAAGHLIWAGGESLSVATLAQTLLSARVVRAVELDINPEWVAGYLYGHPGGHGAVIPVQVVAGQTGVPGQFLAPDSRDFFSVIAR